VLALVAFGQGFRPMTQCLLEFFDIGSVPEHLGEAPKTPLLVAQGGENTMGPELPAVFANLPALVLRAATHSRRLEFLLWLAGRDIFRSKYPREGLAHDLFLRIAKNPLCPRIPACDSLVRINQEDGIIHRPLDQQAKLFLPSPVLLFHGHG